jgi:group I intron endonuclease
MGLVNLKIPGIYKINCLITNKIYIGYSSNMYLREKFYKNGGIIKSKQNSIKQSIIKYGWDNHYFEIIEECSKDKLKTREKYWILFYNSHKEGLNQNIGGGGPITHSDVTKQKISNSNKGNKNLLGFKYTEEMKMKMKKPKSKEHIEKLSKAKKNIPLSEEHKNKLLGKKRNDETIKKMIISHSFLIKCIETNKIFYGAEQVYKHMGISPTLVRKVCQEKIPKGKGYTFKYI